MTNSQAGQTDKEQQTLGLANRSFPAGLQLESGSIILERYRVVSLLGRGGMGSVYHVQHVHLLSDYALKVLDAQSNESTWRRFENEARAANRLDHPNLIKVHDSGLLPDGQPFFVMDMVHGITLADQLKKKGRLPVPQALNVIIQVGFALAYAHENGVIHRDLKPSNIMLVESSQGSLYSSVKVVDLGIAKLTGIDEFNQQTLTKTGEIFGSPLYMSPEQCMGVAVDRRADLYSLGCVMYEALTGAPPLIGDSALSTMMRHQSEKPLSLKEASMGIVFPQAVEQVVAKLLEKDPNLRYSNAQLLTACLVNIQQELQESSSPGGLTTPVSEKVQETSGKIVKIVSTRNIVSTVLILSAFASGLLTGKIMNRPQVDTVALINDSQSKQTSLDVDDSTRGVMTDSIKVLSGEAIAGADKYMNTGKGFFSNPIDGDAKTVRLVFPERSIGEIGIVRPNEPTHYMHEARGTFDWPAGPIAFKCHKDLYAYPNLMEKWRKNELIVLSLQQQFPANSQILLSRLGDQQKLLELNLSATSVNDQQFEAIKKMPDLKRLFLANSHLSGKTIATLPVLRELVHLDIAEINDASYVLQKLKGSKNLRNLRLKGCNLSKEDLETVAGFPNLNDLDLNKNQIVNDDNLKILFPLKKLTSLNLEFCPVTVGCAVNLRRFNLKSLKVDPGTFDGPAYEKLRQALPGTHVELHTRQEDEIPKYLHAGENHR